MTASSDRPSYVDQVDLVFGKSGDAMSAIEERAKQLLPRERVIVWEGDATNFQFLFVSESAEEVLGYPASRWTTEPSFWADTILHPDDRNDAIAYCALCTGKNEDHDFEYRAIAADGQVVWLHDVVRVVRGTRGIATHLRGIMVDVTARKKLEDEQHAASTRTSRILTDVLSRFLPGLSSDTHAQRSGHVIGS